MRARPSEDDLDAGSREWAGGAVDPDGKPPGLGRERGGCQPQEKAEDQEGHGRKAKVLSVLHGFKRYCQLESDPCRLRG